MQRPNVSKHARRLLNSVLCALLEACLVNLELPLKLFICSDVLSVAPMGPLAQKFEDKK